MIEAGQKRLRIYADTSVIGGCFDAEFEHDSRELFRRFEDERDILVVSTVTADELRQAPPDVRRLVAGVPARSIEQVALGPDGERLASLYLAAGVIPRRMVADAQHIAVATIAEVDVLVSWNFKHVVNLRRIMGYNAVNLGLGYRTLEIRTPREVLDAED